MLTLQPRGAPEINLRWRLHGSCKYFTMIQFALFVFAVLTDRMRDIKYN